MSVVLRCPNCGTTRATRGECEACHETTVRYFCTNHTPGVWLAEGTCPRCHSRFGEPGPAASPVAATRRPVTRIPRPARVPAAPRAALPSPEPPPRYTRADLRVDDEELDEELEPSALPMAPWQAALNTVLRARAAAIAARDPRAGRVGVAGCARRLLVIIVFLMIALVTAAYLFGQALFQSV